jgi:hypothetical protein
VAIQTYDDLTDRIDNDFSWRIVELNAIRGELEKHDRTPDTPLARALRRSGAAILYVHWEGYCKNVLSAYFDYLLARRIPVRKASDGLAMLMLEKLSRSISDPNSPAARDLLSLVRGDAEPRISRVRTDDVVNTQSNLRSRVIEDILRKLDLDIPLVSTKGHLIDKSLCDPRNAIAHGKEHTCPDVGEYQRVMDEIVVLMREVSSAITWSAGQAAYLRG